MFCSLKLKRAELTWGDLPTEATTGNFYVYEGSLSYPNCDGGYTWIVRQEPIMVPASDLAGIANKYSGSNFKNGNARDTQPVGSRTIYMLDRPAEPEEGEDKEEEEDGANFMTVIGAAMLTLTGFFF